MMKSVARLACVGLVLLNGCGNFFSSQNGGGGNTTSGDVLYFMNGTSNTISGYTVSSTGVLSSISGSPYATGVVPTSMAITPTNTFLYVAGATGILGYSIGTNGVLTELNSSAPLVTDAIGVASMLVDATGNYLLAVGINLSNGSGTPQIFEYQINTSTGALTESSGFPFQVDPGNASTVTAPANTPNQLYLAPNNQYMYLTLGSGATEILNFSPTDGTVNDLQKHLNLATNGTAQINAIVNSTSTILYVTETGVGVRAWSLQSTGDINAELTGSPFKTGTGASALAFDSTGDYLYVSNKGDATISGFTVASSGALTALTSALPGTGGQPLSMTLDQSKKFLAVANNTGNPNIATYSFDATTLGKLDLVTNSVGTTATGTSLVVGTH